MLEHGRNGDALPSLGGFFFCKCPGRQLALSHFDTDADSDWLHARETGALGADRSVT